MADYSFGPVVGSEGVLFRFWAPRCEAVFLAIGDDAPLKMETRDGGWFELSVREAGPGTRYRFQLPDGRLVPDPASRHQPDDVHGASEVVAPANRSPQNRLWQGRPWQDTVIYELHVGAFTPEGTFRAAIERLDHLVALGITAIQLMPIADFPGRWNWGYDGVFPYAPDSSYGRPEDLADLIEAAHNRGISVFLDVVYNHFGPCGNYLPAYAPLFTSKHQTAWGDGINFDDEQSGPIREFLLQNAVYWIDEFHLDGLRLDAVHAIRDDSPQHFLDELADRVRRRCPDRYVHLIVENEENNPGLLERNSADPYVRYDAQWNDDLHHALHVLTTGETFGYYADYPDPLQALGKALAEGFVYQGEMMPYRGEARGAPSAHLPPTAFISFLHNHDQIGNRATGDRAMAQLPEPVLAFSVALVVLSPQIPMLFMGGEWRSSRPFPYFCDFNADLNAAVRDGRRDELSKMPGFEGEDVPDPTSEETFRSAVLDWAASAGEPGSVWIDRYRQFIALRRQRVVPLLSKLSQGGHYQVCSGALRVDWPLDNGRRYVLAANPSDQGVDVQMEIDPAEVIYSLGERRADRMGPWSLVFFVTGGR